jgi:chromate transporter
MNEAPTSPPTLPGLFAGFFQLGISGFGGVLPHARRLLVERRRWITEAEFTELLGLGQFLPGPNLVNVSVVLGGRFHGWAGALLAPGGLLLAPLVIVLLLATLYQHFAGSARLQGALAAMAAAAAGLILTTAFKMAGKLRREAWVMLILGLTFLAILGLRWPLLGVLAVLTPVSLAFGWWSLRKEKAP